MQLICRDLTTLWCELTSSIRSRDHNDEDSALGIFDRNPATSARAPDQQPLEKEIFLCFRSILQGEVVGEDLRFSRRVSGYSTDIEGNVEEK